MRVVPQRALADQAEADQEAQEQPAAQRQPIREVGAAAVFYTRQA